MVLCAWLTLHHTETVSGEEGFAPLFDGKTLAGWVNVNCAPDTWTAREGVIYCTGKPIGELRTTRMYQNFICELEWRHLQPKGNAGVFVWADALPAVGQPFHRAIEVQVEDGPNGPEFTSHGDIFPIHGATMKPSNGRAGSRAVPTEHRSKPSPEWNHYRITCTDGAIQLAVNGKVVTRGSECSPRKGYICLESEGSPVEFRNLRLQELPNSPITAEQTASADQGFITLYNGSDLSGWQVHKGLVGHWQPSDWTLKYDGQAEGDPKDLWTQDSFRDFELIVDWRWNGAYEKTTKQPVVLPNGDYEKNPDGSTHEIDVPKADSGIFLRSDAAQVNIWQWPIGSGELWDFRTNTALPPENRAAATPKINADHPVGQWNRFQITMRGEKVSVVLNGKTVISECPVPGVPPEGPIGLQHHGDPLEFANIFVRRLDK